MRGLLLSLLVATVASAQPRLILFQQPTFPTTYPASIAQNLDHVESLPADGIVISALPTWNVMDPEWTWTADEIAAQLAPVANVFETVTENFFVVVNYDPGDVFDDAAWANAVGNWGALAQAAREAGFAGLVFDTEEYTTPWLNFPEDYNAPSASLAQYRMQTRLRGRQIAQAITAAWPDAELLVTYGAWLAEPDTPATFRTLQAGGADEYELLGPLFVGLVQGAGPQMTVIDGGEQYQIRTDAEFDAFYDWREVGIASDATDSAFLPPPLRAIWGDRVSTGFGIYNQSFNEDTGGSPMTPAIATATLRRALDRADDVVWFYSEQYQDGVGEWYVEGGMPSEWVEAVAAARTAQPLPLIVTAVPRTAPVVIPASGGGFRYDVQILNRNAMAFPVDVWADALGPDGQLSDVATAPRSTTALPSRTTRVTVRQNLRRTAAPGVYTYRVRVGTFPQPEYTVTFPVEKTAALTADRADAATEVVGLGAPGPNPFTTRLTVPLVLDAPAAATVAVFDVLGRRVATLWDGSLRAGTHRLVWNAADAAPGPYAVRSTVDGQVTVRRVVRVR